MPIPKPNRFLDLRRLALVILVLLLLLPVFTSCAVISAPTTGLPAIGSNNGSTLSPIAPLYDENLVTSLYDRTIPAVVEVNTVVQSVTGLPGFPNFDLPRQERGQGSGFFIDNAGHILTNNHVIEDSEKLTVILHDGRKLDARVIGHDPKNDLALLQVDMSNDSVNYLTLGDSDEIKPGQMAIALGSPYGLEGSITVGIVSGIGRSLGQENSRSIVDVIQTDASINPGNSGGPLMNSKGEVIGINTAIEALGSGIGFAVPSNTVKTLLPVLLKGGEVKTAYLGIKGTKVDAELAAKLDLAVEKGVYVVSVASNSPAARAGLKGDNSVSQSGEPSGGGDVITEIDGRAITMTEDILAYLNGRQPGDMVSLTIYRGKEKIKVSVELGEWPDELS